MTRTSMFLCRERVAQRVQRDLFVDAGDVGGGMEGPVELARRDVIDDATAGKQPRLRARLPPPVAQQVEQGGRQHHVAVLAALTHLDTDQHAL
jgi:hypothetical protein